MLRLLLLVLPLGLDTFAVSAAVGARGPAPRERARVALVLAGFELAMPLVGLALGHELRRAIGDVADGVAVALLAAVGAWMLLGPDDDDPAGRVAHAGGVALLALGLGVSLDELAIGTTIGLLRLNVWLAVALIGVQAFVLAQLGLWLGARIGPPLRERAERLAGLALLGLAALFSVERLA